MVADAASTHYQKTNKRKSRLDRSSNFRKNITGFPDGKKPWKNQVHHILVCCLFKQNKIQEVAADTDKARYYNDCLWVTKWDINRKENLIGLPLWSTYIKLYKGATSQPTNAPSGLPCHTRDHSGKTGYTGEVKSWLKTNIWDSLSVKKEPHPDDLETILAQLKEGEDDWRDALEDRATRQGGTWNAWANRKTLAMWYEPFSMAAEPKPRKIP